MVTSIYRLVLEELKIKIKSFQGGVFYIPPSVNPLVILLGKKFVLESSHSMEVNFDFFFSFGVLMCFLSIECCLILLKCAHKELIKS